jgi:signal transduction histidine kinase
MTRLLKDSRDADKLLYGVQMMGAKAKRLDDITQAMFKLMPEAPYTEALRYSEVSLRELIEESYLDFYPFIEKRNQKLIIDASRILPAITADRNKLRDAIENLIGNAIKFTPDGGTVTVRAYKKDESIVIEVKDQGPGIPPNDIPYIFEPFFSTQDVLRHSSGEADYQKRGIGLGLTVTRHFILLHGGKVDVVSGPGGSTFVIELPIKPVRMEKGGANKPAR